jgi:hypothetical protein
MFEQAKIGDQFINLLTNQISLVTNKTENSIELFNTKDGKKKDQFGNHTGVDCLQWYERSWFERKFKN